MSTNFFPTDGTIQVSFTDENGYAMEVKCAAAAIPSAVAGYATGCELIAEDTGAHYYNTGDETSCTFALNTTIAAGSVDTAELADLAVTTDKIDDLAVTTGKMAANSVDGTKIAIASQAAGDIMYYDGTDWIRLAKGTAGQVLTMNGGATAPVWA